MNLRHVGAYSIGLDIGTGSVGWAVADESGALCRFKGKPTWGSRVYPNAQTAEEARSHRSLRRRYNRRRWRLGLLQEIFAPAMDAVDPGFFARMNQSALFPEDRKGAHIDYLYTLFNDDDFTERDYFNRFKTIYHLRKWLMETEEKADIRLIYLAFHNIVKHRGNFLQQDRAYLSSKNAHVDMAVEEFCIALQEYCDGYELECAAPDRVRRIIEVLANVDDARSALRDGIKGHLGIRPSIDSAMSNAAVGKMEKAIASALVGLSSEFADIFFVSEEKPEDAKTKIYISKDEEVDAFQEICPDSGLQLLESMKKVYSAFVLQEILSSRPGESISVNKVADYERYGDDLDLLKALVKQYARDEYDSFFRGSLYAPTDLHPQKGMYDRSKAKGYTKYNEVRGWSYDEFRKSVEKLFSGTSAIEDPRYQKMMDGFRQERFLRRLKTSDNGAIPFQLHLEEMDRIISNQQKHHPFLDEEREKLSSLVTFRIPYYVGPLTTKNGRRDEKGDLRFAWSVRAEGKEDEPIKPWNWEEVIDKDKSATAFIQRMTGTCSYIQGEPVLPKCSLLYEEFCVLNELNGARFSQDGDRSKRFDWKDREDMVAELFRRGKVSYKKAAGWMRARGHVNVHVEAGQGESGFESKMGSYAFFAKIFGVDEIPESDYPMIEEIILWSTLFEDRSIFKDKLKSTYGDRLAPEQIGKIVRKRFTGWGRLSEKMLTGLKAETDNGPKSIMEILREGNPNNTGLSRAMVLMEILHDDSLGFDKLIDDINKERMLGAEGLTLEELPGSPALRRSINQALGIVEEIVHIAGHAPQSIFLEVTREDDPNAKGKRTKQRYEKLKEAMQQLRASAPEFWEQGVSRELADHASANAALDERLTLYFMQGGKSLYSGKPLNLGELSDIRKYEVDHILPQSYIKDDSFENKALVLAGENQSKSDQMLLDGSIRKKMKPYWDALLQAGLIGKKKHRNLLRDHISSNQLKGFIARQIVETGQIMKLVQGFLGERYPETRVLPVKASYSHELRERIGLPKCREANDFHHAHDAFLALEIGRFVQRRHAAMYDNPIGHAQILREYVKKERERLRQAKKPSRYSFIVSSYLTSGYDEETGEFFKDDWSANQAVARLKKCFDYRQCYVSRMPEEGSGAFWDQTIYSPRDASKKMLLPLKKGMAPEKYGSYSREQFAYFFIYRAVKKGKEMLEFVPVPVSIASRVKQCNGALEDFAKELAVKSGSEFLGIERAKIYKYQLMEMEGSRLYLTGKKEARNATQFAFDRREMEIVKALYEGWAVDGILLDELFLRIVETLKRYSPRLFGALDIDDWKDAFFELEQEKRASILKSLIAIGNGKANVADLTEVGGAKFAGQMHPAYGNLLTKDGGITFVDQSITGMFERRTHVGL